MGKGMDLNSSQWRDVVFEGRNTEYGAYKLRKTSSDRHIYAFFLAILVVAIGLGLSAYYVKMEAQREKAKGTNQSAVMANLDDAEEEEEEDVVIPPPEDETPPPPLEESVQFTPPVITETEKLDKEKEQQSNKEMEDNKEAGVSDTQVKKEDATKGGFNPLDTKMDEDTKKEAAVPETPFRSVEQMPVYPGGDSALMQYLANNIKYPTIAAENNIQGKVILQFVVGKDGSVSDVRVVRSLDASCDKEAMRVVRSMPKWIPGKQNGVAVNVYYTLPVVFQLK